MGTRDSRVDLGTFFGPSQKIGEGASPFQRPPWAFPLAGPRQDPYLAQCPLSRLSCMS